MERIYLVGYRCTGKTTVGRLLARNLQWVFCEMDRMIEQRAGRSIEDIFAEDGEERFRFLEEEILNVCSTVPEAVVSTGGGVVKRSSNRTLLTDSGQVVWLRASVDTIRNRLTDDAREGVVRPPIQGSSAVKEVEDVLDHRRPWYEDVADREICTDNRPPEEIAEEIAKMSPA